MSVLAFHNKPPLLSCIELFDSKDKEQQSWSENSQYPK